MSLVIRICGVGITFYTQVMIAKTLPLAEYGMYSYLIQFVGILSVIGSFGFAQSATKIVPILNGIKDYTQRRRFLITGIISVILVTTIFGILFLVCSAIFGTSLQEPFNTLISPVILFSICMLSLLRFGQEVMRGDKIVWAAQIFEQIIIPIILLISIIIFYSLSIALDVRSVLLMYLAALSSNSIFLILWIWYRKPDDFVKIECKTNKIAWKEVRTWIDISLPLALAAAMSAFLARGDLLLLAFVADLEEVGLYNVAARLAGLMIFGLVAVNTIAAPIFSELWHEKKVYELQKRVDFSLLLSLIFALPILFVLIMYPAILLKIFGESYIEAENIVRILSLGKLIHVMFCTNVPLMVATGNHVALAKHSIVGIAIMTPAVLAGYYFGGITGATTGSVMGIIGLNYLLARHIYTSTGIVSILRLGTLFNILSNLLRKSNV